MWANTRAAYDALARAAATILRRPRRDPLRPVYAEEIAKGAGKEWEGEQVTKLWPVEHPLVRVHPETGPQEPVREPAFTVGDQGHVRAAGQRPAAHALRPHDAVRVHLPLPLAARARSRFWDNRATMHYGIYDYGDERRVMHRVTLRGDRPEGGR